MKENSVRMKYADTVSTTGLMESSMKDLGKRIKCTGKECSSGRMERDTRATS